MKAILPVLSCLASAATAAQYCDPDNGVCFSEVVVSGDLAIRLALPETDAAPFDMLVQMSASTKTAAWAGLALGGKMTNNPLLLGWGDAAPGSAMTSVRWAAGHVPPTPYADAAFTMLPKASGANYSYWTLTALCQGCASWSGGALDPTKSDARLAYALSTTLPATPQHHNTTLAKHSAVGNFAFDLAAARSADFEKWVEALSG
ncbi:hypothetical protein F4780DRAFT_768508 [Xylariomycetidae sp. FL0641]|nr:hypothetical protein F4780DRAFT_768508 [Xylariomycetidae sp. FL0641]